MAKVQVEQGWLEGEQLPLVTGDGSYYSFKGIPYAAPPVGELRFKAPQPPSPWEGVRKATQHGSVCPQFNVLTNEFMTSSEDCLFLNVYSPDLKPKHLLPVMFFIHGGGYKSGSGDSDNYGPDFLMKQGVVLVTINYRLEVLGFLSLENADVPGNAGMKDQVEALRWVKQNILNFGGDPNNVTIFGESAGGASVGYHILSPMSKGLFQRAILMSGSPLCDWGLPYAPRRRAFVLGKQLGKSTNDDRELVKYFRGLPVDKFLNTDPTVLISETLVGKFLLKLFHHTPVVEQNTGSEHFLPDTTENLLRNGELNEVDIMVGYTSEESLFSVDTVKGLLEKYETFAEMLVPREILQKVTPAKALEISDKIRAHYFGDKPIDEKTLKEMIHYISDSSFVYDIHRFLKLLPRFNDKKRFLYKFSCVSERNIFGNPAKAICPELTGTSHLDDLFYLFDPKRAGLTVDVNSKSYKMIKQTSTLFANFAKYGDPTPAQSELGVSWPQYDVNHKNYLEIGETLVPGTDVDEDLVRFWQSIYDSVE
ncbi:Esterase FE4 [Eumeta japonica]|uniref:Carboxylic ester hydrolase n=1 Tax=Eumeta variegata TaxID=151549 RepID=A0A4C1WII4_EUMVA|nr:Esterase FE4 [Eumeta japonica]